MTPTLAPAATSIRFVGDIKADEFVRGYKLVWRGTSRARHRRLVRFVAIGFAILLSILASIPIAMGNFGVGFMTLALAFAPILLLIFDDAMFRWQLKKHLSQWTYGTTSEAIVDEAGLHILNGPMRTEFDWSAFIGFRHDDELAILFSHAPNQWIMLSRRLIQPPEDWDTFLGFTQQKLPAK